MDARRGLTLDEAAAPLSFTVEATVLLSFALPRGACSGVSMSAESVHRRRLNHFPATRGDSVNGGNATLFETFF
jgi:hypothetical protein